MKLELLSICVFPARAGVILLEKLVDLDKIRLSRTSGGDPDTEAANLILSLSFPHERG